MTAFSTRIDRLQLENFRCFSKLDISFHGQMTVITAPNGGGKTALLDAISIGWHYFIRGIEMQPVRNVFQTLDIRRVRTATGGMQPVVPVRIQGDCQINHSPVHWEASKGRLRRQRTPAWTASEIREVGNHLRLQVQDHAEGRTSEPEILPMLGYYGTGRLWAAERITEKRRKQVKPDTSRNGGYSDCLSPNSRFGLFEVWFGRMSMDAFMEGFLEELSAHRPKEKLQAVSSAVDALLKPTGWHSLMLDANTDAIDAKHPEHGRLPVSMLSDGIRMMIGLVGDIAHRCTRLNPHFGADAAQLTPGVVMIDEVDMHLHPEWQQLVLKGLTDAFPRIQFIVTTHSPQVLTTVKRENIRILAQNADGLWSTDMPDEETKGDESATLLASVMGVDPVPQVPEAADLNRYRHLIQLQQQDSDEGKTLKIKLDTHFGPRHHLMLDCDRMIRLAQFKAKLPIPASQS